MRLLADVHVKSAYIGSLRSRNHEVVRVQDELKPAAPDADVVEYAREEGLVVLTNDDKDFREFGSHHGVLFVPQDMAPSDVASAVSRVDQ